MSLKALPLHSDGTFLARPPARFMLTVTSMDENGGGLSTFMPVARFFAAAPDWAIEALLTADFLFPRSYDGDLTVSYEARCPGGESSLGSDGVPMTSGVPR